MQHADCWAVPGGNPASSASGGRVGIANTGSFSAMLGMSNQARMPPVSWAGGSVMPNVVGMMSNGITSTALPSAGIMPNVPMAAVTMPGGGMAKAASMPSPGDATRVADGSGRQQPVPNAGEASL